MYDAKLFLSENKKCFGKFMFKISKLWVDRLTDNNCICSFICLSPARYIGFHGWRGADYWLCVCVCVCVLRGSRGQVCSDFVGNLALWVIFFLLLVKVFCCFWVGVYWASCICHTLKHFDIFSHWLYNSWLTLLCGYYGKMRNWFSKMVYEGKHGLLFIGISLPYIYDALRWQVMTRIVYISTLPFVFCLCTVATSSSLSLKIEEVFGCRKSSRNS